MLEDFLPLVTKPARYIGSEINVIHKDLSQVATKICLFFPDTYEVGMSHLGLRILYEILNKRADTACERVFSPWPDYEERLRASGSPLKSLESNLPLPEFDIIGFTLQYELSYSNVLAGLDLARIPLRSSERNDSHPIVVAGGPCTVNPEPLADFIDVFFIGEAEDAVHELIDVKQASAGRQQFLEAIAEREGFFVPALAPRPVRRRYIKTIETAAYPDSPLVPLMKPVHDRATVEVARGCIRGCRFCQAGIIYRPFRERSPERVRSILARSLACTGYEELSLASLSSGDYSSIEPLILELMHTYRESRVSVSLPSLRVGTLTPAMIEAIASTRKTGFTLAPEAGTERLRRVINKPVSNEDLLEAVEKIFGAGWSVLKLYFMIGLPTETDEDLDGMISLAHALLARGRQFTKRHIQINISVSTFVPKAHTPFQWIGQVPLEEIRGKQTHLQKGLRKRGLSLKLHDPETSLLEAAFARGDRSIGRVIEEAVRRGSRFDGWTECFDFRRWEDAFRTCGLRVSDYASRAFSPDDALPWAHVRTGVTEAFLRQELRRAEAAETTGNCRTECTHCGMGCKDGGTPALGRPPAADCGTVSKTVNRTAPARGVDRGPAKRIRIKYTKTGRIRFLSHLDFMTLFQRAASRAGVPIAFSQGFNPHPKMAFGPALPVGSESDAEYLDVEADPFIELAKMTGNLNQTLPSGVSILDSRVVPMNAASLSAGICRYDYSVEIPDSVARDLEARVERFLRRPDLVVTREGRSKDIRPCIEAMSVLREGTNVRLLITVQDRDAVRARLLDVITSCFEVSEEQATLFRIRRTAMYCRGQGSWISPLNV